MMSSAIREKSKKQARIVTDSLNLAASNRDARHGCQVDTAKMEGTFRKALPDRD